MQQARWTSPRTNKLLLEAGFGTTYYQWGGRELDPNPTDQIGEGLPATGRQADWATFWSDVSSPVPDEPSLPEAQEP